MKSLFFAALVGLATSATVAGCTIETGTGSDTAPDSGTVRLELQGSTPNGTVYRLRQAVFTVSTTPPTTINSDAFPANATTLSQALPPGSYTVSLQPNWVLERVNNMGVLVPVTANLTSPNPAMIGIQAGANTTLTFQFTTNGQVVTTNGTLNIGIGVTELDGGTGQVCTPFSNPPTCGAPLWCGPPPGGGGQPVCQAGGNVPVNGMCTIMGPTCAANLLCAVNATGVGLCKQACQPGVANACPNGGVCTSFSGSMQFGTCP